MKGLPASVCAALILALGLWTSSGQSTDASSPAHMSVTVLSVAAPHVISKTNQIIRVHVRYSGITMDPLHIGRKSVAGHGHMQLYLDRIPAASYIFGTTKGVVVVATTSTFNFVLSPHWLKAARGRHHFIIALARNDDRLYRLSTPSFTLTVK